jgi:fimbrial chaperone protein
MTCWPKWPALPAVLSALLGVLLLAASAQAGQFGVTPMGIELDRKVKSGVITLTNEGDDKNTFQLQVSEWTHDAEGKETYTDTTDIIFYPKIVSIEPKGQQVVRIGFKGALPEQERSYRIFIREIPNPSSDEIKNRTVVFLKMQFALPIFVSPAVASVKAKFDELALSRGDLRAVLKSTGNKHVKFSKIVVRGYSTTDQKIYETETSGWYVLSGRIRSYRFPIPADACEHLSRIDIEAIAERITVNGSVNVQSGACKP